jgi:hypothetical protein
VSESLPVIRLNCRSVSLPTVRGSKCRGVYVPEVRPEEAPSATPTMGAVLVTSLCLQLDHDERHFCCLSALLRDHEPPQPNNFPDFPIRIGVCNLVVLEQHSLTIRN